MVPPRPLQATPTPSSGMLKGACGPPPQLAPPEKSGLIGDRTVSLIGEVMFVFSWWDDRGWLHAGGGKPPQRPFEGGYGRCGGI